MELGKIINNLLKSLVFVESYVLSWATGSKLDSLQGFQTKHLGLCYDMRATSTCNLGWAVGNVSENHLPLIIDLFVLPEMDKHRYLYNCLWTTTVYELHTLFLICLNILNLLMLVHLLLLYVLQSYILPNE
uniref:Uncharacterized protein n=1 Tax=Opuntia streptacantha TaxID=393608 RepID=A0A7C9D758_OPUST